MAQNATPTDQNPIFKARSRRAVAIRLGDSAEAEAAGRDLAALKLERYVADTIAAAPPLTDAQAERIASLLRAYSGGGVR